MGKKEKIIYFENWKNKQTENSEQYDQVLQTPNKVTENYTQPYHNKTTKWKIS